MRKENQLQKETEHKTSWDPKPLSSHGIFLYPLYTLFFLITVTHVSRKAAGYF